MLVPIGLRVSEVGVPISNQSFEAIAIRIHFDLTELVIVSVYRAPSRTKDQANFLDLWLDYYNSLKLKKVPHIIVGDFNLPNINWKQSTAKGSPESLANQFLSFCLLNGLDQKVLTPTRIKNSQTKNILDLVLVSEMFLVSEVEVIPAFIESDHQQVVVLLGAIQSGPPPSHIIYDYFRADYNTMESILVSVPWDSVFASCKSVDEMYVCFANILSQLLDNPKLVPCRLVNYTKKHSWPPHIRRLAKDKKFLHEKFVSNGYSETDKVAYRSKCKAYKMAIKELIRKRELSVLNSQKDNKFWSFVRSKLTCRPSIPTINNNGTLLFTNAAKADCFNNYFASVFTRDNSIPPPNRSVPISNRLSECSFAPESIYEILVNLPMKTSCGPDRFPPIFLRKLAVVLSYPLSLIFEKSFTSGEVPDLWKQANVTPIHKKSSASHVSNYRPISLTSAVCKVFESILREKITDYLRTNRILSEFQHGFVSKKSTVTQLLLALNEWTSALDSKQFVDIAYLDYQAAFDSVVHSKLAIVLSQLGIGGKMHRWIVNYLNGRTQRVKINDQYSAPMSVLSSVPQGTCLGPLLFIIYINELPKIVQNSSVYLFADDCKLHICYDRTSKPEFLQRDLNKILQWSDSMQLKLSLSKCSILNLGKRTQKPTYELGPVQLENCDFMKDLGVIIDSELKFSLHCSTIVKKASARMNCIFRSFETKDTSFLLQMYKTFVRPKLEYASPCWSPYLVKDIKLVESVQRAFTRRIPEIARKNIPYAERLAHLNLESLELRRLQADLVLAYKLLYGHLDIDPNNLLTFHPQAYANFQGQGIANTVLRLQLPKTKRACRSHFFGVRIVSPWNRLPSDVKLSRSVKEFKALLCGKTADRSKVDLSPFLHN